MAHLLAARAVPAGLPLHMLLAVPLPLLPAQMAADAHTSQAQQRRQAAAPASTPGRGQIAAAPAVQRIFDTGTGLDQIALHGVQGDAQPLGNHGLLVAMDAVGHKGGPAAIGQTGQCGLQHRQRLAVHDGISHIGRMAGRQLLVQHGSIHVAPMALTAAVCIQRHMLGHHRQVGGGVIRLLAWRIHLAAHRFGCLCMLGQFQPSLMHQLARLLAAAGAARGRPHQIAIGPVKAGQQRAGEGD